jgi:cobalt-zinc-cadmium resistance protein CzcA
MRLSEIEAHNMELMIKGMAKKAYYRWMMLKQEEALLQYLDSLYGIFERVAEIRFETGDINYVNKLLTHSKAVRISLEARKLQVEIASAEDDLRVIMNSPDNYTFRETDKIKLDTPVVYDTSWIRYSPSAKLFQQKIKISEALIKTRRNETLPGLEIGYFNQSIDNSRGFHGWVLGLNFPLWYWSYDGTIKSARVEREIAKNVFDHEISRLRGRVAQLQREVTMNMDIMQYYEGQAVNLAEIMIEQAQKSFAEGEIGLLDYIENISDAIDIKREYIQAINSYNQAVIDLEILLSEKNKIE